MARKDEIQRMRDVLVIRRDALRRALAGDLSLLSDLQQQGSGDVIDAALDSAQGEINSQILYNEPHGLNTNKDLPKVDKSAFKKGVYY